MCLQLKLNLSFIHLLSPPPISVSLSLSPPQSLSLPKTVAHSYEKKLSAPPRLVR